ncbi:MAG: hypothetical protein U9R69_08515 [Thermodesulfobacteriota bacterium]|nr:hypothetical protein [Thermodesulfobacteriota bacterium]
MENQTQYNPGRRAHQRFTAVDRALVHLDLGSESLPYHIMDISKGGLSFRYLGEKLRHSKAKKASLYHNSKLIIDNLSVATVSDYHLRDNLVPVRRGSVFFKEMSSEQSSQLETFIQKFTEVPLPAV